MSAPRPRRDALAVRIVVLAAGMLVAGVAPVRAQSPEPEAARFAAAWGTGDLEALRALFAPEVRLTLDGRTRTGVRPEQMTAALQPLLERFAGPAPAVVRAEPIGGDGESGFAELRWTALARDSGAPRTHTFLLTFVRTDDGWRISDLRIPD